MATGANYPTSFDSYANKVTGDYLTVADVNSRSDAIEALETGPLRPNLGSVGAPAYSFQGDTDTGMYSSGANTLDFALGGVRVLNMAPVASAVNYFVMQPSATAAGIRFLAEGADTNITITYDAKGTGQHVFRRATGSIEDMRIAVGLLQLGTSVITGSTTGEMVIGNNRNLNGVNVAGTSALNLIGLDTADRVFLAAGGSDIRWGRPLVSMGGGATATLGTIGATGPTTLTQNSWMRVVASDATVFWLPVWK